MNLVRFSIAAALPLGLVGLACSAASDPTTPGMGVGGASSGGETATGSVGNAATGSTPATGSQPGTGSTGATGTGGRPVVVTPGSYALPPPDQCINDYYVENCVQGDASTACGGVCTPPSAGHNEGKTGEWGYACPRFMLFSDEMNQATLDDAKTYGWSDGSSSPFHYAVAGHDFNPEIDTAGKSVCCQCYQIVIAGASSQWDGAVIRDGVQQVPTPPPLIVQTFNTGATTTSFDIYLAGGGVGAFNACYDPTSGGPALYSGYPTIGQTSDGGVKAVGNPGSGTPCKDAQNIASTATLSSPGCLDWVAGHCNQITHTQDWITQASRRSCIDSNKVETLYHLNWEVYVKRVACPAGLTQVTGCKIIEDQPPVDPTITTAAAAQAAGFKTGFHLTSMQDCAKPTCAAKDKVTQEGHTADGNYNSFYTCDQNGTPWTE